MIFNFANESLQQDVPLEPRRATSAHDAMADFIQDAQSYGLQIQSLDTSGNITRVTTESKPTKHNGWYCFEELHPGYFVGTYGDWRESDGGVSWRSWTEGGVSDEERAMLRQKAAQREIERKQASKREQVEKSEKLNAHFQSLPPCQKHDYATNKHIGLYGDVRLDHKGAMVLPLVWTDGSVVGLQKIYPDGEKRTHGVIDRTEIRPFGQILGENDHIYIAEGYSTCSSIHEATGKTVIVALYANRLKTIAQIVRDKAGEDMPITIVADNDTQLQPNKGVKFAREAADAIGAEVVIPEVGTEPMDANDMHVKFGLEMLKTFLEVDGKSVYKMVPLNDVVEKEYAHNPVVEGLIDEGECAMLVGDSNLGKSILSLHIAAMVGNPDLDKPAWQDGSISFDGPPMLFGHFPILSKSLSLSLQDENSGKNIQKRIRSMCESNETIKKAYEAQSMYTMVIGDDENPCADGTLMDLALFKALKISIMTGGIRLLIVDPMSSYLGSEDENNAAEMLPLLNKTFRRLARETGCACLVIAHTGKGGVERGVRGSSAIKGWSDCVIMGEEIEVDDEGKVIKMIYDKSRSFERRPGEWYMRMDNNLNFSLLEDYEPPNDNPGANKKTADTSDVVRIVDANGEFTGKASLVNAIASEVGCSKANAKDVLDRAVVNGLIRKFEEEGTAKGVRYTT